MRWEEQHGGRSGSSRASRADSGCRRRRLRGDVGWGLVSPGGTLAFTLAEMEGS